MTQSDFTSQNAAMRLKAALSVTRPSGLVTPGLDACFETLRGLPPIDPSPRLENEVPFEELLIWAWATAGYGTWLGRIAAARASYRGKVDPAGLQEIAALPGPHKMERPPVGAIPPAGAQPEFPVPRIWLPAGAALPASTPSGDGQVWQVPGYSMALPEIAFSEVRADRTRTPYQVGEFAALMLETLFFLGTSRYRADRLLPLWTGLATFLHRFWQAHEHGTTEDRDTTAAFLLAEAFEMEGGVRALLLTGPDAGARPLYCTALATAARKWASLGDGNEPVVRLRKALDSWTRALEKAAGLRVVAGEDAEASDTETAVHFPGEQGNFVRRPAIYARGDPPRLLVPAQKHLFLEETPKAWSAAYELARGQPKKRAGLVRAWLGGVASRCRQVALQERGLATVEDVIEATLELGEHHDEVVQKCMARAQVDMAKQWADLGRDHLGLQPVGESPGGAESLGPLSRAIDWEQSKVQKRADVERGRILALRRYGFVVGEHVVGRAVLEVASGPTSTFERIADAVARAVGDLDWVRLSRADVAAQKAEYLTWSMSAGPDFFQDGEKEADLIDCWLLAFEEGVGDDVDRAMATWDLQRALLRRRRELGRGESAPVWLADGVTHEEAARCGLELHFRYQSGWEAGRVAGVLLGSEAGIAPRGIVLSRGPEEPDWSRRLATVLEAHAGVFGDAAPRIVQQFARDRERAVDFDSAAWRLAMLEQMLRAGRFSTSDDPTALADIERVLAVMPESEGLRIVPRAGALDRIDDADRRLLETRKAKGGVFDVFSDDVPSGRFVAIERVGLFDTRGDEATWRVAPQVVLSAGPHTSFSKPLQPALLEVRRWLARASFPPGKAAAFRRLLLDDVWSRFRAGAGGEDEREAARALLAGRRGLVEFVCVAGCREPAVFEALREAGGALDVPTAEAGANATLTTRQGTLGETWTWLATSDAERGARLTGVAGGVADVTAVDVGLGLLEIIAREDDVDPELSEVSSIYDTVCGFSKPDAEETPGVAFLLTKTFALRAAEEKSGREASSRVLADVTERATQWLARHGIEVFPIDIGQDVRRYEGRYRATSGARNWMVTRVVRPCLLEGTKVLQVGIVDTN